MPSCEHEWVGSPIVHLTDPPQQDFICRHCLEEKRDWLVFSSGPEYVRLKGLKQAETEGRVKHERQAD